MKTPPVHSGIRTAGLTMLAMIAFAANSLLCRKALGDGLIDAASFTAIRIIAGAVTLVVLVHLRTGRQFLQPNWPGIVALSAYMWFFSFAYLWLGAAIGALLLFGAVQLTMFVSAIRGGERFSVLAWAGLAAAFGGLVYLVAPGVTAPDPSGATLMVIAGIAWGIYSLRGRHTRNPLHATTSNFLYSAPLAIVVGMSSLGKADVTMAGALLAALSGALASGIGYAIWFAALAGLTAARAATVQLSVPIIAAIGAVLLLDEALSGRLLTASGLTIGGIWLVLRQRHHSATT